MYGYVNSVRFVNGVDKAGTSTESVKPTRTNNEASEDQSGLSSCNYTQSNLTATRTPTADCCSVLCASENPQGIKGSTSTSSKGMTAVKLTTSHDLHRTPSHD